MAVRLGNFSPPCPIRARSPSEPKLCEARNRLTTRARLSIRKVRDCPRSGRTSRVSSINQTLLGCCVISFSFLLIAVHLGTFYNAPRLNRTDEEGGIQIACQATPSTQMVLMSNLF